MERDADRMQIAVSQVAIAFLSNDEKEVRIIDQS